MVMNTLIRLFCIAGALYGVSKMVGGGANAAPPVNDKGFTLNQCVLQVQNMETALKWAAEQGATMPLRLDQEDDGPLQEGWVGELTGRLWGDCDMWAGPNVLANPYQAYLILLAALQAAFAAKRSGWLQTNAILVRAANAAAAAGVLDTINWPGLK
jgi:hypothetical protein